MNFQMWLKSRLTAHGLSALISLIPKTLPKTGGKLGLRSAKPTIL